VTVPRLGERSTVDGPQDHPTEAGPPAQTTEDRSPLGCPIRRRRGEALEQAILAATLEELATHGYGNLTMEGVAAAARTGKASLYRRWGSKEDLVLDAVLHHLPGPSDCGAVTGHLRNDLLALLGQSVAVLEGPKGALVRSLLGEVDPDSSLLRTLRVRLIEPRLQALLGIIERAIASGEARPGTATPTLAEVGPAVLIHRHLLCGRVTERDVIEVVDEIVLPLLRAERPTG
jgi:AcrR family transcriptional regulator